MTKVTRTVLGAAKATIVVGSMTAGAPAAGATFSISDATGWPTGTFAVVVADGVNPAETILCSARSGTTLTVATAGRGFDGSAAVAHQAGAAVVHDLDLVAVTALLEHVNTDAGFDHTGVYLKTSSLGVSPTVLTRGQAVAQGASNAWIDAGHVHAITAPPMFRAHMVTTQTVTNNTVTKVSWDTVDRDTNSGFNVGTHLYTVPTGFGGLWELHAMVQIVNGIAGTLREIRLLWNAAVTAVRRSDAPAGDTFLAVSALVPGVVQGQVFEVDVLQVNGGNLNIGSTGQPYSYFAGRWVRP